MKKTLLILPLFSLLTGCGLVTDMNNAINESTWTIQSNREAIERSTQVIRQNAQNIRATNRAIEENRQHLEKLSES